MKVLLKIETFLEEKYWWIIGGVVVVIAVISWGYAMWGVLSNPVKIRRAAVVELQGSRAGVVVELNNEEEICAFQIKGIRSSQQCKEGGRVAVFEFGEKMGERGSYLVRAGGRWMIPFDIYKSTNSQFEESKEERVYGQVMSEERRALGPGYIVWRKEDGAYVLPVNDQGRFVGDVDVSGTYEVGAVVEQGLGALEVNEYVDWGEELVIVASDE